MIEKCPRDLPLYSPYVLSILDNIISSNDINFIEYSVPAFTALSTYLDYASFAADPVQSRQFDGLIQKYASFASNDIKSSASIRALPEILRLKTAGLKAISGLVASDSFYSNPKNLRIAVPTIIELLASEDPQYIRRLEKRESAKESFDKQQAHRRRPSMAASRSMETVRTARGIDTSESDPVAAAGTTEDVDKRAKEELGVLALQTLRTMFSTDNRGQLRSATALTINSALEAASRNKTISTTFLSRNASPWLTDLFSRICDWAPLADKFVVLVTMVESLTNDASPIPAPPSSTISTTTEHQQQLAPAITHLLRSDYNFIGLSVLDVLLGILDTIRSGGPDVFLAQLRDCVGALAGHIYYGDQISDMVSAIVNRLEGDMSRACVQEVVDASRCDLKTLRLSAAVRVELGLEVADPNGTAISKASNSGSGTGSGSRARKAREREQQWRNGNKLDEMTSQASSHRSVIGVDELKKALSGAYVPTSSVRPMSSVDTASESMMSGDFTASEVSLPLNGDGADGVANGGTADHILPGPYLGASKEGEPLHHDTPPPDLDAPPVPALPASLRA